MGGFTKGQRVRLREDFVNTATQTLPKGAVGTVVRVQYGSFPYRVRLDDYWDEDLEKMFDIPRDQGLLFTENEIEAVD